MLLRKPILMIVVGLLTASLAKAQYREESGALEQIYESRVRSALNTIMRPGEFSVVISVDINRDPKQLNALEEEMDKMSLPGVPGLAMTENMNVSNKLHELRNQVSAQLILDNSVSKEKEAAARSLASVKLHLDESAGDKLTVLRANMMPQESLPAADLLPELSWRMWALVLLVSLLSLGFLFMALQKRKAGRKAEEKQNLANLPESGAMGKNPEPSLEEISEPETDARDLIELYERKKSLTALAARYPEAASRALDEQFEKGSQKELMIVFEAFGWESSKELFPGMSHRTWGRLGSMMMAQTQKPTEAETLAAMEFCHRAVVAKYLELADGDLKNPFAFLTKLLPDDRARIFAGEAPRDLALICAYLDSRQKTDLLESLNEELQQAALLEMAKLREVPYESVQKITDSLRRKAQALKEKPIVSVDSQAFLIQLLGDLDVVAEMRFIERLRRDDPTTMENLRRVYLQFADLVHLPQEVLSAAFGALDLQVLTASLTESSPDLAFHCFKSLPEKRAKMVEKDLAYSKGLPQKQILSARRLLLKAVRAQLLIEGREPGHYFSSLTLVEDAGAA